MILQYLQSLPPCKVLAIDGRAAFIDLAANGPSSGSEVTESFISALTKSSGASFLAGGYLEKRTLYSRSDLFGADRNIHIGFDLWAPAGTPVIAPLKGKVHSFDYNTGLGNYGPTIILEHKIQDFAFYTLYGHLSAKSLEDLEVGNIYEPGHEFSTLGTPFENGNYAPHLHFQIILDIEGHSGDYPGVCTEEDLPHYKGNCPDPNLLLKLDFI